jgi:hypothetical protein
VHTVTNRGIRLAEQLPASEAELTAMELQNSKASRQCLLKLLYHVREGGRNGETRDNGKDEVQ